MDPTAECRDLGEGQSSDKELQIIIIWLCFCISEWKPEEGRCWEDYGDCIFDSALELL